MLSVHHAAIHTLNGPAFKIVENHLGKGFFKIQQAMQFQMPAPFIPVPPPAA